ncbi:MAG: BrnT family toxin [Granulosicoccus sp.]
MEFTWDKYKGVANEKKHGVTFHEATTVFNDPLAVTFSDPDHSRLEYRYLTFGCSRFQRFLVVSHTDSENEVRIISARDMNKHERNIYEDK